MNSKDFARNFEKYLRSITTEEVTKQLANRFIANKGFVKSEINIAIVSQREAIESQKKQIKKLFAKLDNLSIRMNRIEEGLRSDEEDRKIDNQLEEEAKKFDEEKMNYTFTVKTAELEQERLQKENSRLESDLEFERQNLKKMNEFRLHFLSIMNEMKSDLEILKREVFGNIHLDNERR